MKKGLFLLAPVSLHCEGTISTNQKGTACSLTTGKISSHATSLRHELVRVIVNQTYHSLTTVVCHKKCRRILPTTIVDLLDDESCAQGDTRV